MKGKIQIMIIYELVALVIFGYFVYNGI